LKLKVNFKRFKPLRVSGIKKKKKWPSSHSLSLTHSLSLAAAHSLSLAAAETQRVAAILTVPPLPSGRVAAILNVTPFIFRNFTLYF